MDYSTAAYAAALERLGDKKSHCRVIRGTPESIEWLYRLSDGAIQVGRIQCDVYKDDSRMMVMRLTREVMSNGPVKYIPHGSLHTHALDVGKAKTVTTMAHIGNVIVALMALTGGIDLFTTHVAPWLVLVIVQLLYLPDLIVHSDIRRDLALPRELVRPVGKALASIYKSRI